MLERDEGRKSKRRENKETEDGVQRKTETSILIVTLVRATECGD